MTFSSDLIRGHIDTIIMARLLKGDTYGYEINKELRLRTNGTFEIKEATLYTAFRRLEESRFISSYWGPNEGGARRRIAMRILRSFRRPFPIAIVMLF